MQQHPINERLSFLLKSFEVSARAFSEAIGEKPTITQNYVGTRNSMPGADYIEKVLKHFDSINPTWLLTGQGSPFLTHSPAMTNESTTKIKKTKGNVQANSGHTVNNIHLEDCQKELATAKAENQVLHEQLASRDALLASKDALIAAKDETISLLRASYTRPN